MLYSPVFLKRVYPMRTDEVFALSDTEKANAMKACNSKNYAPWGDVDSRVLWVEGPHGGNLEMPRLGRFLGLGELVQGLGHKKGTPVFGP